MITRHYKRIVKDILQRGGAKYDAYAVTASDGRPYYTAQEQPNYSADQTAMSMSTDQPGVIIGNGTAAESETSYWLAQQITSGFSGSVLPTHEMVDGTHTLCLYVTIANTGNNSITISEIGYALITPLMRRPSDSQFIGSPYPIEKNVLIDRTVLASPITIAEGNSVRLKYALKTTDEIFSGSVVLIPKTISANGVYNASSDNADGYSEVTVSVTPNLQSKTATQNGTVTPDQGYDGLSSVVVNVSGGGGSNVFFGAGVPEANLGANGDYYIRDGEIKSKYIRIDITKVARGSTTNFNYYGSRAISIVCKDESDNEVEISPYILEQYYWRGESLIPSGSSRRVFRADIGSYVEDNGLPGHYAARYAIPNSYRIYKIKLTRRNSSQYHDYWVSFDVYQCDSDGHNLSLLLSEQNLTESDWSDWDSFTEFSPTGQLVDINELHEVYEKQNGAWVAI